MTRAPKISVLMNCYNSAAFLKEAIDSVFAQTFKDWEIIFWDNLSTDHSAVIAKQYEGKLRYFLGKTHLSLGAARNCAIEKAAGDYIGILDCDDVWLPDKLEKQVPLLENNPRCGLVYADTLIMDSTGNILGKHSRSCRFIRGSVFIDLLYDNVVSACSSLLLRRETLERVGVFDPRYEIAEESELILRIAEKYEIDFVDEPLVKARRHGENSSKRVDIMLNELFLMLKEWNEKRPEIFLARPEILKETMFKSHVQLALYYAQKKEFKRAASMMRKACSSHGYNPAPILRGLWFYARRRFMRE